MIGSKHTRGKLTVNGKMNETVKTQEEGEQAPRLIPVIGSINGVRKNGGITNQRFGLQRLTKILCT
jgi:hypothetical protein